MRRERSWRRPQSALRAALGARLRSLRKARRWSQERLAEATDMHATYVGSVERGERNVSFDCLAALATGLDITLSELFDLGTIHSRDSERSDAPGETWALLRACSTADVCEVNAIIRTLERWRCARRLEGSPRMMQRPSISLSASASGKCARSAAGRKKSSPSSLTCIAPTSGRSGAASAGFPSTAWVRVARAFGMTASELLRDLEPGEPKRRRDLLASILLLVRDRSTDELVFLRSLQRSLRRWSVIPGRN